MAGLPALVPLLSLGAGSALLAVAPPPAPPPPPPAAASVAEAGDATSRFGSTGFGWTLPRDGRGDGVSVNGLRQQAQWRLEGGELWLPLDLLEGQLGVSHRQRADGALSLEWFGQRLAVPRNQQRSLDDEVAVPVARLLQPLGLTVAVRGAELELNLPSRPLLAIRSRDLATGGRRVVFDLAGPGALRSGAGQIGLAVRASAAQQRQLAQLGLGPQQRGDWLTLQAEGQSLSLAGPWRLVLDLLPVATDGRTADGGSGPSSGRPAIQPPESDQRLANLIGQGVSIERRVDSSGGQAVLVNSVRLDPVTVPVEMRPLNRADGMQGLSSLSQLARGEQALIAINGGFFNRVNRLPLGALRDGGVWLSGPILNRGAIGWQAGALPSFGRLSLEESVEDSQGGRWPLTGLNSGYVQRGLARYTAAWGRSYSPISGQETAVLVRQGRVIQRFSTDELTAGVPLRPGDELLVARGGVNPPWQPGDGLMIRSRPSHPLGLNPFVMGGGPLLLQDGQLVLNGAAEGFGSGFLSQGAPRTVIASDGRQLWLLTLQGVNGPGPTLLETARLLQRQGLRDALNLDGGSSTGLMLGEEHRVKGRGVVAAIHNGLGLVPRAALQGQLAERADLVAGP